MQMSFLTVPKTLSPKKNEGDIRELNGEFEYTRKIYQTPPLSLLFALFAIMRLAMTLARIARQRINKG